MQPAATPRIPGTTWRLSVLVCLSSVAFFIVVPALPLFLVGISSTGEARRWAGPVIAASFVTAALMSPVWGALCDRFGARRMMTRAGLGGALCNAALAFATSPAEVFALRLATGALGGLIPAAMAYATATAGPRGAVLSSVSAARSSGGLIGPAIGGLLIAAAGYRTALLAAAAVMAAAGLGALTLPGDARPPTVTRTSFVARVRQAVTGKGMRLALGLVAACAAFSGALQVAVPLTVQAAIPGSPHRQALWVGLIFSAGGVVATLLAVPWGHAADRLGWSRLLPPIMLGSGAAIAGLAVASSVGWIMAGFVLYSAIACEAPTLLNLFALHIAPAHSHGTLLGLSNTAIQSGLAIGPLAAGAIIAGSSPSIVYVIIATALALIAALQAATTRRKHTLDTRQA